MWRLVGFDFVPSFFPVQEMPQEILLSVYADSNLNNLLLPGVWHGVLIRISNASSSVDGHLGCFHLLTIMNNGAINICIQVFV